MPSQRSLFENQQTLEAFCEKIVLPNMTLRTFEEELFEDDPAEYVRRDLESASASRLPPVPSPLSNRMW
jgi:exportin-2 (importin alpha re-exporter)